MTLSSNLKNYAAVAALGTSMVLGGALLSYAQLAAADTTAGTGVQPQQGMVRGGMHAPGVFGTITAMNGSTITISDKRSGTTYTIDASAATVLKNGTSEPLSDLAVGDQIMVQGTVSGTSVTATTIHQGAPFSGNGRRMGGGIMGTVSAVNGSTITITGKDGKTYTVDASNSTVEKMQTISVTNIQVGDTVGVRGSVSGTLVTANHVVDGIPQKPHQ